MPPAPRHVTPQCSITADKLRLDRDLRHTRVPLLLGLAHAKDGHQPRLQGGGELRSDRRVIFAEQSYAARNAPRSRTCSRTPAASLPIPLP